jgi:hypothetical protein
VRTENGVVTPIVGELFMPQLMAAICDVYNGDCDGGLTLTGVGMEPTGKRTSGSIRAKLRHCRPNVPRGLSLEEMHTRSNEQTARVRHAIRRFTAGKVCFGSNVTA